MGALTLGQGSYGGVFADLGGDALQANGDSSRKFRLVAPLSGGRELLRSTCLPTRHPKLSQPKKHEWEVAHEVVW